MAAGLGISIVLALLAFKVFVFVARLAWSVLTWMLGIVFSPTGLTVAVLVWLAWCYEHRADKPKPDNPPLDNDSQVVVKV